MKTISELLDSIDDRLRQVKAEIETLNAARAALDGRRAPANRRRQTSVTTKPAPAPSNGAADETAPTREPAKRRRRRRAARAAEVVPAGRLERLLSENGGLTTSALAEQTNGDRDQILTLLRELERAGRIRRTGQRRATRWHAITDEDRIRERAAELERRRRRPATGS
jgi:cell division septum initiation protein DivIVA